MAENIGGFLQQLTGSDMDETAIAQEVIDQDIKAGGRLTQMMFGLGAQGAGGLGALGAGLLSGVSGGRIGGEKGAGFKANFKQASNRAYDGYVAKINGITPEELRARREIRKEVSAMQLSDDGTHANRIAMAERAVEVAKRVGDPASISRALDTLQRVEREAAEWNKLQQESDARDIKNLKEVTVNGFTAQGDPVTGYLERGPNGEPGLMTADGFRPFDEGFSLYEPNRAYPRGKSGILKRLREATTPTYLNQLRNKASSAMSTLIRTDRVMESLFKLYESGEVGSVIGDSGKLLATVDNFVRNVQGVVNSFAAAGKSQWNDNYKNELVNEAMSGASRFAAMIALPEGVQQNSADAQRHQALVMEMAYMAARLAEPSNRGLSDNDIANALMRIAGDTSNPQVMARRLIEMQGDATAELEFELGFFKGGILGDDVEDYMVDEAILGNSWKAYHDKKAKVFGKYGIEVDQSTGTAKFAEPLGVDSELNDTPMTETQGAGESTADFAKRLGIPGAN